MNRRTALLLLCALTAASAATPASAQRAKVGTLDCDISAGMGLILGSRKEVRCRFSPSGRGRPEVYVGSITKFGLDVGATAGGRMVWAVYAPTSLRRRGALAGTYSGASGEATVGGGLGANVLLGGNNRTIALQPVSIQAQAGLNLAVGVAGLTLVAAR
ncbi:MAG TPA: DUF992 domain-containing protein [Xanthobacteraceae bacterium]|nr:DUF992 domain-containing protein [Xanthobacteraceae bacterium]